MFKIMMALVAVLIAPLVDGDANAILDQFTPGFNLTTIFSELGAPDWVANNIEVILLIITVLLILSFLTAIYRGIRVIIIFFRGVARFFAWIFHFIKNLRGRLNPKRKKKAKQETLFEAMKVSAKKSRHKERMKKKREKAEKKVEKLKKKGLA